MPENKIDAAGITIQTYDEIVDAIINGQVDIPGLKQIYGSDINTDSNTPDGQMVNIYALSKEDILQLIVQDYSSKDPDQAVGVALDGVSELCGIFRKGGTYTETPVNITSDRSLTLNGLDNPDATPFTISDDNGNLFYLIISTAVVNGVNVLDFRAKNIGAVQLLPNTLTKIVTVTLGITASNNPDAATQTGEDQESDAEFRIRRQKSVAIPAKGYLQNLLAGLLNIVGVTAAVVRENTTNSTDGDGIPAHSIWVIVQGGDEDEVAEIIYTYRNAGCGMKGATSVDIDQVDGTTFAILFDRPVDEDLYIQFTVSSITSGSIDEDYLKAQLVALYRLGIYDPADITSVAALVRQIIPDTLVTDAGVGLDGMTYDDLVYPTNKKNILTLSTDRIDITIV